MVSGDRDDSSSIKINLFITSTIWQFVAMRSSDWFVQVLSRTVAASGSCLLNVREKHCVHLGNNVKLGCFRV